jgi:RNA polymerase sigma-70 factor (ECF subfamily)
LFPGAGLLSVQFVPNEFARRHVLSGELIAGRLPLPIGLSDHSAQEFDGLVAAHRQMVLRTAYRLLGNPEDARDAAQEVFLRLFKNQSTVDGDPKAWLYRVTVNVCNDHHRGRKYAVELGPQRADPAPDPERLLTLQERKRLIVEGLETLAERERACVVLRDIEGLSTAEVAAILGVEEVTVRSQIHSARLKLARYVRRRR